LHEASNSGIGNGGNLSWDANVIPGFESLSPEAPRGFCTSEGNDCCDCLADASDRVGAVESAPDILITPVARDSFKELGLVMVRTAIVVEDGQLSVQRRNENGDREKPQSCAVEVVTIVITIVGHLSAEREGGERYARPLEYNGERGGVLISDGQKGKVVYVRIQARQHRRQKHVKRAR